MPRGVFSYLRELAYLTMRQHGWGFRFSSSYFAIDYFKQREGFNFEDEVQCFCWLSGCSYRRDVTMDKVVNYYFRLPKSAWW
jgi:hypothetical protein